jgi:hypothetical protein
VGLLSRLLRRRPVPPLSYDPHDPSLAVVVRADDPARADSAVLADAAGRGVDVAAPMLVRHRLVGLQGDAVEQARVLLAQDGYRLVPGPAAGEALACRTEVVTGLSASRERSRMAGLAQRLGGDVAGWEGLQPPPERPA